MSAISIRKFGRAGFDITDMGFGAAPIGNFLRPIPEHEAGAMIDRAWDAGMRYFDTAPYYGHGLSELRLGHYLRWKPRRDYVISSKVGRVLTAARREDIERGLLTLFVQRTSWLFYRHIEDKYPDKS